MEMGLHYKNQEPVFREVEGSTPYLEFQLLADSGVVRHAFSTRLGGVSAGCFSSLNLSFTRGDDEAAVRENFRRMAAAVGVRIEDMVFSRQTHTTNVHVVTESDRGMNAARLSNMAGMDMDASALPTGTDMDASALPTGTDMDASALPSKEDIDGLVTNVPGVCLVTFFADCVPLYFVDPVRRVIGLSHSGWRGTVGKIGKVTVERMREAFGCDPKDILAAIGPSVCQACYEVSGDVIGQFKENFAPSSWEKLYYRKENGKYQLDLWKANELVFLEAGILPQNMAVTNLCTHCNHKILYSHRAMGNERGNLAAFLALKGE